MCEEWCKTMLCKNCRYGCCDITDCISSTCWKFWLCSARLFEQCSLKQVLQHQQNCKCKFWDRWTESQEEGPLTTAFMELNEKPNAVTEEQISVTEWFIGFVYYWRCINSIDLERMRNFEYLLHGNLELMPPPGSGLGGHIRGAVYYADWVIFQCVGNICLRSPSCWGWKFSNRMFTSLWHSSEVTINADSLTATCGCSSQKCIKCKCTTFPCIPFCKCQRNCVYKSVSSIFIDILWFGWFFWCIHCLQLLLFLIKKFKINDQIRRFFTEYQLYHSLHLPY